MGSRCACITAEQPDDGTALLARMAADGAGVREVPTALSEPNPVGYGCAAIVGLSNRLDSVVDKEHMRRKPIIGTN